MTEAYQHVANHSIRNRGTLGGNLCHNDPAFEIRLVVTLLGATMIARSARSTRTIAAEQIFQGAVRDRSAGRGNVGRSARAALPAGHGYCFLEIASATAIARSLPPAVC